VSLAKAGIGAGSGATVVALRLPLRPALVSRAREFARGVGERVLPPLIMIVLIVAVWQVACDRPGATLPPPSKVLQTSWELIFNPFYDRGGLDKGLFWHLLASLQRVAIGYTLAAFAGIALGVLIGQSTWALRGLDRSSRCCAPCRRWPGCRSRSRRSATASRRRSS
jgi:nitrate/nitrite transport system permease protein